MCLHRCFPEELGALAPVSYTWDQQTAGLSSQGALGPTRVGTAENRSSSAHNQERNPPGSTSVRSSEVNSIGNDAAASFNPS